MNKIKFMLLSIMTVFMASCSHNFEPMEYSEQVYASYAFAFEKAFGTPDKNQTWGFGSTATRGVTRAVDTWTDGHSCDWSDKLNVVLPEGATEMTSPGWLSTGVYVVPTNGSVSLNWANFNDGDKIYILGNVTELKDANYNGTVTFYNVGTLTYSISSGNRHTIINTGTLTINSYGNVGEVYNSGTLNLVKVYNPWYQDPNAKADIPDAMSVFSTGEGSVLMPDGGDFKGAADIHGTLVANGNTKIQNSKTQYICGIEVDGVLDMTEGHLQASNIEATEIKFDGAEIWLTAGGHIKADVISMPNSATAIYGESTSTGFIEVGDIVMGNTNNFEDTFTSNIYFKITGAIDLSKATNIGGKAKKWNSVEEYIAAGYTVKGYTEGDNATGSPACGQPWSVGTTTTPTPDPEEPNDPETPNDDELDGGFTFLCRVFAEDLSATQNSDFDFNDVVFDVYTNGTDAKIKLLAAGGTLPLTVAGKEVHDAFGDFPTSVMINTGDGPEAEAVVLDVVIPGVKNVEQVKDIPVYVFKTNNGEVISCLLTAEMGKAPAKFAVTEKIEWAEEHKGIETKYPDFKSWVTTGSPAKWW